MNIIPLKNSIIYHILSKYVKENNSKSFTSLWSTYDVTDITCGSVGTWHLNNVNKKVSLVMVSENHFYFPITGPQGEPGAAVMYPSNLLIEQFQTESNWLAANHNHDNGVNWKESYHIALYIDFLCLDIRPIKKVLSLASNRPWILPLDPKHVMATN
jgi:hypothetical protein